MLDDEREVGCEGYLVRLPKVEIEVRHGCQTSLVQGRASWTIEELGEDEFLELEPVRNHRNEPKYALSSSSCEETTL